MRAPQEDDILIDVEGVGQFRYARRTLGDNLRIRAEFIRNLNGMAPEADEELAAMANVFATHKILCSGCPTGWEDFASMREEDRPTAANAALELFIQLQEKEDSFRRDAAGKSKEGGA